MHLSSQALVNFTVKPVHSGGKTHKIEALVLQKIMSNIPSGSVAFNKKWKHLSNLTLADPEFGVPGSMDIKTASGLALQDPLRLSKQRSVGYWLALSQPQEFRVNRTIIVSLLHLPMTFIGNFGK